MHVTDGQTDRQNYDSQDRASIAASRGKMGFRTAICLQDHYCAYGDTIQ